jgi:hypothetical protein
MIEHEKVLDLLSQLKAGKGLVILATVIQGLILIGKRKIE